MKSFFFHQSPSRPRSTCATRREIRGNTFPAILLALFLNASPSAPAQPSNAPTATPATLNIRMLPALHIVGQAWAVQQVQYEDVLGDTNSWIVWTNIVMGDGPVDLIDTSAPAGSTRFYRVVTLAAPGPDPAQWTWINPNTFTMGSPATEYDRSEDESPQTTVTLTYGYWMERHEATQQEYQQLTGTNTSWFLGTNRPVEQASWFDASNYCALLTSQERLTGEIPAGYVYRLPTEAEWECAARAGTTNRFPFGDDHDYITLQNYAWFSTNSDQMTHDVEQKEPNPWGLYDMSGNVWEWTADYYGPYAGGSVTNPVGPAFGTNRVMRGGSWLFPGGDSRPAARNFNPPNFASHGIGFRVVLAPPLP